MITFIAAILLTQARAECKSEAWLESQYVPPTISRGLTNRNIVTDAEFGCLSGDDQKKFIGTTQKWLEEVVPKGQLLWGSIIWLANHDREAGYKSFALATFFNG